MSVYSELDAAIERCARRAGVDPAELRQAVDGHDVARITALLDVDAAAARPALDRLERAWTFQGDVGAGCQLLTDGLADEVGRALGELAEKVTAH